MVNSILVAIQVHGPLMHEFRHFTTIYTSQLCKYVLIQLEYYIKVLRREKNARLEARVVNWSPAPKHPLPGFHRIDINFIMKEHPKTYISKPCSRFFEPTVLAVPPISSKNNFSSARSYCYPSTIYQARARASDILYRIVLHRPKYADNKTSLPNSPRDIHVPSVLSQVCRRWRDVVHGVSTLWSEIRMDRADWTSRDFKAFQQQRSLFARLSGTLPLSVDLR
ncbi:hypothetical protein BJ165DRAFT_315994 [Panaeolus papilionaceus]|nr:hypothetical protein BJ165DRAFT_315994 [Panaeolus papilionaceus]